MTRGKLQLTQSAGDKEKTCGTCNEKKCYTQVTTTTSEQQSSQKKQHRKEIDSKWIMCDNCCMWYHGNCQGIESEVVIVITDLDKLGVKWFCTICIPTLSSTKPTGQNGLETIEQIKTIEQMLVSINKNVEHLQQQTTEEFKKLGNCWANSTVPSLDISKDIKKDH